MMAYYFLIFSRSYHLFNDRCHDFVDDKITIFFQKYHKHIITLLDMLIIFLIIFHDIFSGNWAPISTTPGWKSELGFQQNPPLEIGAQFGTRAGGIEPPTFCLQA